MNILILNCGSSSIKFQIAEMPDYNVIIQGSVERIGYEDAEFKFSLAGEKTIQPVLNHEEGINLIINTLFKSNLIEAKDINAIGHRVVQGGDTQNISVMIADKIRNSCINTQILTILKIIIGVNVSTFFKSIDSTLTDFQHFNNFFLGNLLCFSNSF